MKEINQLLEDILARLTALDERTFEIMQYINGECIKKREIKYIFIILNIISALLVYLVIKGVK